jgi:hypothetical protein
MELSNFENLPENFRKLNINLLLFINKCPVVIPVKNCCLCMLVGSIDGRSSKACEDLSAVSIGFRRGRS